MATNLYQLPGTGSSSPAAAPTGIAPAPQLKMPPVATPGGGTGGAPLQPTGAPVAPLPNFNPASRDAAIRNLGTQTPAAPTVAPATAPAPAAETPGASGAPAAGATGPIPVDIPPTGGAPDANRFQALQPYIAAIHDAADQQAREQAIQNLLQQVHSGGFPGVGAQPTQKDIRGVETNRPEHTPRGDFGSHWDQFEHADQEANAATNQPQDNNGEPTDAELNAQAQSNRRVRQSRQNGIYTGKAG